MREIVLDTETTGLDPLTGDRIVEIGAVELLNHMPTGRTFHKYINPQRDMPAEAFAVHGLSAEFLADKPLFAAVVDECLDRVIPLGEAHLRELIREYSTHYHAERPHQGLLGPGHRLPLGCRGYHPGHRARQRPDRGQL